MTHIGIDIYSGDNSPPPDFRAAYLDLKARGGGDEPFLIIKATEGLNYMNPFFAANLADAKRAGFKALAAYHFFHPSVDAGRQVAFFRAAIGTLPGALDDEDTDGMAWSQVSTAADTFLRTPSEVADQHYLNGNFLHNESGVKSAPLWWPTASGPTPPGTWITQDQGMVAGFAMLMDVDRWAGTEAQFVTFFAATLLGSGGGAHLPGGGIQPSEPWKDNKMARFQYSDGGEHVVNVDANGNLTHRFDVAGSWKSEVLATGCQPGGGVEFDINYRGQLHLWAPRPESTLQHCWYDTAWHAEVLV